MNDNKLDTDDTKITKNKYEIWFWNKSAKETDFDFEK